jgi:hypothetical protein
MRNIAVLIDYTEGSKTALRQAELLTKKVNGVLYAINIASSPDKVNDSHNELIQFIKLNSNSWEDIKIEIGEGNLFSAIPAVLKRIEPSVVIICTHGIKGMFQHLFGAHILKLVQSIPFPSIVIQENNQIQISETKKVLFPLGPHPDFKTKIKQTIDFAKMMDAEIYLYQIDRPGMINEDYLDQNLQLAKQAFSDNNIIVHKVIDEMKVISAGFSRQTMDYAMDNNIQLISLMASVSKLDTLYGVGDKENFLVNPQGIPIFCCME